MSIWRRSVWLSRLVRLRLIERPWWRWRHRGGLPALDPTLARRLLPYGGAADWLERFKVAHSGAFGISVLRREAYVSARARLGLDPRPVITRADAARSRIFDVLGSGPTRLPAPLDWDLDFKSGLRFPRGLAWTIDYRDAGRASDVKVPWEVARFHAGVWLGQAYWLTGDEAYAQAFADLTREWLDGNPPGEGIHWACPMELGIRAVNWSMAFGFFHASAACGEALWERMFASLIWHGRVIRNNLEYGRRVGNHFIADAMGLFCLGALFRETKEGRRWMAQGHRFLEEQIRWQVFPDGVHYEQSISYHRLVTEMFSVSYVIGRRVGVRFSDAFLGRLSAMFEYTATYTRPDGTTPLCSDADDGRVLPFGAGDHVTDHRHLLAIGGALLARGDLCSAADGRLEDALWLTGPDRMLEEPTEVRAPRRSRAFRSAGVAVIQDEACHAFLDAAPLGIEGDLVHGHLDSLSVELYAPGGLFVSDSGCYAYTSDPAAYREFTSTAAHNVPVVDGADQAALTGMWRIAEDGTRARLREWGERPGGGWVWEAEHHGYERLPGRVLHVRRVEYDTSAHQWIVTDRLLGGGIHEVVWRWHLAPGVSVHAEGPEGWVLTRPGGGLLVSATLPFELAEGWVAPSYGVRVRCPVLIGRVARALPITVVTRFQLTKGEANRD